MHYFVVAGTIRAAQMRWYEEPEQVWKNEKVHYITNAAHLRGVIIEQNDIVLYAHDWIFNPQYAQIKSEISRASMGRL